MKDSNGTRNGGRRSAVRLSVLDDGADGRSGVDPVDEHVLESFQVGRVVAGGRGTGEHVGASCAHVVEEADMAEFGDVGKDEFQSRVFTASDASHCK